MGSLFGGYLSQHNDVWLVDVDKNRVAAVNASGVCVREADGERRFFPRAVTDSAGLGAADLVVVFVKAMFSGAALENNKRLIGPDTYLMTLQNGAGHEAQLLRYTDEDHVVIGTTQHNSSVMPGGCVHHGGTGRTAIGLLSGNSARVDFIAETFTACGFETVTSDDVQKRIWEKLFINTAASSLTAVLQVPLGFILEDAHARALMHTLAREAVAVANAVCPDASFEPGAVIADIEALLANSKNGCTSIYADLRDGRRTEVDTISGSVVAAAARCGVPAPCHSFIVDLVHAMENRAQRKGDAVL